MPILYFLSTFFSCARRLQHHSYSALSWPSLAPQLLALIIYSLPLPRLRLSFFPLLTFSLPPSPQVLLLLLISIALSCSPSLSLRWLVNHPSLSFPRCYQCVSLPLHSIIFLFSSFFSSRAYPRLCVLCACRKIKRIAETKHLLGAANGAFKQLIHPHPTVQLCCTDSLKQDFCLMKMHQRLVHWFFTWSDLTMILSLYVSQTSCA